MQGKGGGRPAKSDRCRRCRERRQFVGNPDPESVFRTQFRAVRERARVGRKNFFLMRYMELRRFIDGKLFVGAGPAFLVWHLAKITPDRDNKTPSESRSIAHGARPGGSGEVVRPATLRSPRLGETPHRLMQPTDAR